MSVWTCATAHCMLPPQPFKGHFIRRCPDPLAVRRSCPSQKRRDHRQAPLRRLFHHFPWLCRSVRVCASYMTGKSHTGPQRNPVCTGSHAVHERLRATNGNRRKPLSVTACTARRSRVHNLQVRKVPPAPLRHHPGRHGQAVYHKQLPRPRYRAYRRL